MSDQGQERSITPESLSGTPDEWYENAQVLTPAEDIERSIGSWYITPTSGGNFILSRVTEGSRRTRRANLRSAALAAARDEARVPTEAQITEQIERILDRSEEPAARLLLDVAEPRPAWMDADIVTAHRSEDDPTRVAWLRRQVSWRLLSNQSFVVSDTTMARLDPRPAEITEV